MTQFALFVYFVLFLILLKTRSIKPAKIWFVPLFSIYVGLILATLLAIFLNGADSSLSKQDSFLSIMIDAMNPVNGRGKVLYGGYFGLIVGYLIMNFVTRQKSLSTFLDISAICTSLLFAVWRINCFLKGCCYGMHSEIFGISFPNTAHAFRYLEGTELVVGKSTVPLFPTQLISAAGNFAIFFFLLFLFCKNKTRYPYFYLFAHALLYGLGRFTVEFFRIDPREFWGPLSMSQWISLVLVAAGLVFFIKNRKEIVESFNQQNA